MAYKLIKEFVEVLDGNPAAIIRGPMSPFLLMFPWQRGENPLDIICINKGRDSFMAIDEKSYYAIAEQKFARYYNKSITIDDLKNEYDSLASKIQTLYDKVIDISLADSSAEKLHSFLVEILDLFLELAEKTIYIEVIDYDTVLKVIGRDKKSVLDAIWEKATHPTFISFEGRRLKQLIDLISSGKKNLVRKAKFIFTDYVWTKKEEEIKVSLEDIRTHVKEKTEEYEILGKNVELRKKEYERWKKTLSKEAKFIVEYIQLVMLLRDLRKDIIAQLQALQCEISVEMLCCAKINEKYAPTILIYEYMKGIEYLKSIQKDIEKRHEGCISIVRTDVSYKTELCDFDEAISEFDGLVFKKEVHTDIIKGHIANKGKIKGIVRIVLDPHDDKGFKKGDILVTGMTRPEFVPLMKQAGAVITNEGGITCHAAIISRELNIPCIIGTKIATKVLKDGDMVEVDADRGIVTILI